MHSPTAAFAWEFWQKNRSRLILIFGTLFGFIIFYPQLCAMEGFNPASSISLDEFSRNFHPMSNGGPILLRIGQALLFLFLLAGPITAMFLSLLCVTWMFTVLEFDPTSKNSPSIPGRLFTLPISTRFLFLWLFLGGTAMIFVVFEGWIRLVRMPYLDVFGQYQRCFGWLTFLPMAQAIVWSLAAWPITRFVASLALLFCFMGYPVWENALASLVLLPLLFSLGAVMAGFALRKMRHGQWQGWTWKLPSTMTLVRHELRGPRTFASQAQAQLWFEWRRFARTLGFFATAVSIVPVALHLIARFMFFGSRPMQYDTLFGFTIVLLAIPLILHGLGAASPGRVNHSFLMTRPLTGGDMTMAILKAAAISTVLSWAVVFIALAGIPLLGNFSWVNRNIPVPPEYRATVLIGLIFLTWRSYVVNLCLGRSGHRWLVDLPILIPIATLAGFVTTSCLTSDPVHLINPLDFVPFPPTLLSTLLICLVAMKLLLAFVGFYVSLKRRLLAPSSIISYLFIWLLLLAILFTVESHIRLPSAAWFLPLSLIVVLLVPLARISFCPLAIEHSRQT